MFQAVTPAYIPTINCPVNSLTSLASIASTTWPSMQTRQSVS